MIGYRNAKTAINMGIRSSKRHYTDSRWVSRFAPHKLLSRKDAKEPGR
jgi:hypothetical protein